MANKDANWLEAEIIKELKSLAHVAKSRMEQPAQTWRDKPVFTQEGPTYRSGDLVVRVTTEHDHYFWLDEGTKSPRHAVMSRDFRPKTKVRSFNSGAGSGDPNPAHVSKNISRPGIEARKWTEMTSAEYGAILQSAIDKILAGYKGKPISKSDQISRYVP